MQIAYIILAHHDPVPLARLVKTITKDGDHAFIHVDLSSPIEPFQEALSKQDPSTYQFVANRVKCYWGDITIVQATLNAMQEFAQSANTYDYVTLLSGQDYPVRSIASIKSVLRQGQGAQYIEADSFSTPIWESKGGFGRVDHFCCMPLESKLFNVRGRRVMMAALSRIFSLFPNRVQLDNIHLHGGSQWWTLTADCVRYMVDYAAEHPELERFFHYSYAPDEMYFQTLIMNSPFAAKTASANLRFVEWNQRPRLMDVELVEHAMASDCHFARKFDSRNGRELCDLIDQKVAAQVEQSSANTEKSSAEIMHQ